MWTMKGNEMKCPSKFEYYTLDEVAETVEGVTTETYRELWRVLAQVDCDHTYREPGESCKKCGLPFPEWPEPDSPDRKLINIARHWSKLSESAQKNLIEIAKGMT